ncbi:hypothetical protein [Pseudoalteromonas luteoviolacea]|uniref:Uncharacterized protein n=2 Tax=Pseudoalteromonas luteoviolacea TaxID=43657 RepID=A0A166XBC5_9GAMM|nr:hypothetical protein [Pseudoalteromonas luteoviolacea]KZN31905.1 hypothetical protein N480_01840 [Pseudoalteromonas luteoviolacea S2607]KZN39964.1 hypothetical protein N475_12880 [Pseudoalteromonas luteoviolacea DSM 6061]KZN56770.1 hypothetical protein N474_10625 [Pseudoalteromonas luteoviolacea CPMOR-2]KZN68924.1 hypothetical protein N478_13450 [Pseudoalteromonas luteoviolacea S4060-1]MBE0388255.1 hypothetical protein [Pseudoalteromonas luteoviolacea DSM 6061]
MIIALYLVLCILSGYWGRNTFAGPVGFFLIGLFFTPIVSLLILLLAQMRQPQQESEDD